MEESTGIRHIDSLCLAALKKDFADRITIMDNVTTVEALLQGTPEDVTKESIDCINKAAKGGGYLLSAACTVPPAVLKPIAGYGWRNKKLRYLQ